VSASTLIADPFQRQPSESNLLKV